MYVKDNKKTLEFFVCKYKLVGINFCFLIVLIYTQIVYIMVELES